MSYRYITTMGWSNKIDIGIAIRPRLYLTSNMAYVQFGVSFALCIPNLTQPKALELLKRSVSSTRNTKSIVFSGIADTMTDTYRLSMLPYSFLVE